LSVNEALKSAKQDNIDLYGKLEKAQYMLNVFDSETTELLKYMKDNHIKDGEWVKIKWYQIGKWWELGKRCFTYVKNVLSAFGIKVSGIDVLLRDK
jgi:hypothetical protein